jgi:hypothetical protein
MQRQLQLLQAASLRDPSPQPWRLNVRTEASSYFITEGALNPSDEGSGGLSPSRPKTFAEPLGLGSSVPRFLRWDESVELSEVGLQELLQQVSSIWQGKAVHEALHGPCHLQEYVYYHCIEAASMNAAAKSAAATAAGTQQAEVTDGNVTDGVCGTSKDALTTEQAEAAAATAAAAAAAGYQLYHSLSQHRPASVAVDTMWQVLTGQLPEAVLLEQQRQLHQLLAVMEELQLVAAAGAAAGGGAGDCATAAAEERTEVAAHALRPTSTAGGLDCEGQVVNLQLIAAVTVLHMRFAKHAEGELCSRVVVGTRLLPATGLALHLLHVSIAQPVQKKFM